MATEDLARANQRLSGEESFTVAPSRYLGHYVAGHLARRPDVRVELQDSPAGGITARIDVPAAVLAHDDGPVAISGPDPGTAAPTPTPRGALPATIRPAAGR